MAKHSNEDKEPNKSNRSLTIGLVVTILGTVFTLLVLALSRENPVAAGITGLLFWSVMLATGIHNRIEAKANKENYLKHNPQIIGSSVFIAILFVSLFFGAAAPSKSIPLPKTTRITASQVATKMKSETVFPVKIDDVTDMTDITSQSNVLQYHHILHDMDTANITDATLRDIVQPTICKNESYLALLKDGIEIQYLYTVKETGQIFSLTTKVSDCSDS